MRDPRAAGIAWRDLAALRPYEVATELALPLLGFAAVVAAGASGASLAVAPATAAMFMAGLRVAHGGFHRALGLGTRANDAVLFALSLLLGGSMHAIEVTHLRHHRDCLADDDVEGRIAALGFGRALLASARYPLAIHRSAIVHGSRRQLRWIFAELAGVALVQAWIWTCGGATARSMALWLLVANALAPIPGIWFVHRGCRHGDARIARSARASWLVRLTISMFHHAEHHAFPAVPTRHLRELARRFDACGATPLAIGGFSTACVDGPVDKLWIEVRKRRADAAVKRGCANLDHRPRERSRLRRHRTPLDARLRRDSPSLHEATTMKPILHLVAVAFACALAAPSARAVEVTKAPARLDAGAAEHVVATPPPARPRVAVERKGMTWGVGARLSADPHIVFVSCHGRPAIDGHGCEAYHGDTACSAKRTVLCLDVDGRARPDGIVTPPSGGVMHAGFYSGWAQGRVALAPAVRGDAFARRSDADAYCVAKFGAGWRVAEHHDGVDEQGGHGGWGFVAEGRIAARSRFWVAIDDTEANCWDPRR